MTQSRYPQPLSFSPAPGEHRLEVLTKMIDIVLEVEVGKTWEAIQNVVKGRDRDFTWTLDSTIHPSPNSNNEPALVVTRGPRTWAEINARGSMHALVETKTKEPCGHEAAIWLYKSTVRKLDKDRLTPNTDLSNPDDLPMVDITTVIAEKITRTDFNRASQVERMRSGHRQTRGRRKKGSASRK